MARCQPTPFERRNRHEDRTCRCRLNGEEYFEELPERVRDALGELAGAAKEGLLALSVGVRLGVLDELMPPRSWSARAAGTNPDRVAVRHGHDAGEVTLGGRRVAGGRPRVRSGYGSEEVALQTYRHFAAPRRAQPGWCSSGCSPASPRAATGARRSPLGTEVEQAGSTSKSTISREFVSRTPETLAELMSRRLDDVRLAVPMIDGICLKERTNVVALGITTVGVKIPLWDGSTENATVATALPADLFR